ncbi:MAG TPA: VOC family protein [Nitrososphaerales archaeon]|nr:VOC family protein [Nitrososphaerales archaeon]HUK75790.1 VOC family protein [Nitrososphaerales archaeon]
MARKRARKVRKASRPARRRASGPKPIPTGFRTITPYLSVIGASSAIDFYEKAFGAKELRRDTTPEGKIMNATLRIGDSLIMLSDNLMGTPMPQESSVTIHLYSRNVDKLWNQAVTAGAKVTMPLDNQFWGERYGQLVDPFGHKWSLSTQVKMSAVERNAKMEAAMKAFSQAEQPQQQSGQPAQPQV